MIYVKEDNKIKKYEVEIDKDKLKQARIKIIINCSYLTHVERKVREEDLPNEFDYLTYRNFNKEHLGIQDTNDFFSSGWTNVYRVTYDKAEFPEIIKLIDRVLDGNYDDVISLLNYKEKKKEKEKNKVDISISSIEEAKKAKEKADEIIKKLYDEKLNEKRLSVDEFMDKVKDSIKLILVDEIELDDFNKIYNFVDDTIKGKIDKKLLRK